MSSFIKKDEVINRNDLIRMAYASGFPKLIKNPKNLSESSLFSDEIIKVTSIEKNYPKYVLAYLAYKELQLLKVQAKKPVNNWFLNKCGFGLRYGDFAVAMVVTNNLAKTSWKKADIKDAVKTTLDKWKQFENRAFRKKGNLAYFNSKTKEFNPIGYYKSDNLIKDLIEYFS